MIGAGATLVVTSWVERDTVRYAHTHGVCAFMAEDLFVIFLILKKLRLCITGFQASFSGISYHR